MAVHDIWVTFPAKRMKNVDTTIEVYVDKEKRGTLELSRGTVDWTPARKQSPKAITWERLADLLDEEWDS